MQWYEILVIALAVLFVGGVIGKAIRDKMHGKSGCDCSSCCGNCSDCKKKK
ncbi:MAG: FeoB-associated Cys-rich membrane protein [Clostridia bacterium]|nr:FeoB-associated Cys-rich membrane protein [Clostridia bacterium]